MSQELIEAVAKALYEKEWEPSVSKGGVLPEMGADGIPKEYWIDSARAALAAIEASGLVMVPKELVIRMPELNLNNYGSDDVEILNDWAIALVLSARPKVTT